MLDEGNEFNKSSLGSHMLATLPEGESKDSVRAAKGKTSYAPHSSPYGDTFPPGGRLKMLSKVAFGDGGCRSCLKRQFGKKRFSKGKGVEAVKFF